MKANMTALLRLMLCAVAAPMARTEADAAAFDAAARAQSKLPARPPVAEVVAMEPQP